MDLPNLNGDFPVRYVSHNQMVTTGPARIMRKGLRPQTRLVIFPLSFGWNMQLWSIGFSIHNLGFPYPLSSLSSLELQHLQPVGYLQWIVRYINHYRPYLVVHPTARKWLITCSFTLVLSGACLLIPLTKPGLPQQTVAGWWFQTFFMFHNIWDNPSHWCTHIF